MSGKNDMDMHFTYNSYKTLVETLQANGYNYAGYDNWQGVKNPVILRHDIDTDISKAVCMAELEQNLGAKSTYFVLLTSDFYNVASKKSRRGLQRIIECGHAVGLHFDEVAYTYNDVVLNIDGGGV